MKLTPKQRAFCDYYISTGNATEAAIKAKYSKNTAAVIGTENLRKPNIKKYIDEKLEEISSNRIADAEEIMEYLTKVLRKEEVEPVISQEQKPVIGEDGKKRGYETVTKVIDVAPSIKDRNKAAEQLGKRYRLWTDKVEVEGAIPIVIAGDDELED
ncbi:terminase small subunit [Metaclostridioides mangenotii]|uniref:Phage terminase small subunit n=1 Tax=Metaclostridioides mangenotii TaxID=1540 RepID=A0ABS4EBU2_9FIRM|nr:terminase small subunit [Clostridioides mangenotii]MBP1855394.1 phage terminase small subunit [Clostridioides mangenotii]